MGYIRDTDLETYPYLNCEKRLSMHKEYFLEMPIKDQLQSLLLQEGFYTNLQGRFKL